MKHAWLGFVWPLLLVVPILARGQDVPRTIELSFEGSSIPARLYEKPGASNGPRAGVLLLHDAEADSASVTRPATTWSRTGRAVLALELAEEGKDRASRVELAGTGLAALKAQDRVAPKRLVVVGMGERSSQAALDLASTGGPIQAIVCQGHLPAPPEPEPAARLAKARVQVLLAPSPDVAPSRSRAFQDALKRANVTCRVAPNERSPLRVEGAITAFLVGLSQALETQESPIKLPDGVPDKVGVVLAHVDEHGEAMPNYEGGRTFLNLERRLPQTDRSGRRLRYREWDVNPLRPGVNRGAERLVTGSDGSAFYTRDHYETFLKIR